MFEEEEPRQQAPELARELAFVLAKRAVVAAAKVVQAQLVLKQAQVRMVVDELWTALPKAALACQRLDQ